MCPSISRHYYEWMLRVNNQFPDLVATDKDLVLEQLRSDADLAELAVGMGLVASPTDDFAIFLGTVPAEQQASLKDAIAAVVEADGDIFFDAAAADDDSDSWGVATYSLGTDTVADPSDGMIVVLTGPWDGRSGFGTTTR